MKKCPYCAEEIQDEAIKCRYCNEKLPVVDEKFNSLENLKSEDVALRKCPYCGMENMADATRCKNDFCGEFLNAKEDSELIKAECKENIVGQNSSSSSFNEPKQVINAVMSNRQKINWYKAWFKLLTGMFSALWKFRTKKLITFILWAVGSVIAIFLFVSLLIILQLRQEVKDGSISHDCVVTAGYGSGC